MVHYQNLSNDNFDILDALPIGCCIFNRQFRIIYTNDALLQLLGLDTSPTADELFSYAPTLQPDGQPSIEKAHDCIQRVFIEESVQFEWVHQAKSLGQKNCFITLNRITRETQTYAAGFILELESQSEKAVNMLQHLKIMLDSTPLCCHCRDAEHRIIDCNQQAMDLFGFSSKESYIRDFDSCSPAIQPDGTPSVERPWQLFDIAAQTGCLKYEWMHQNLSGELIPCEKLIVCIKHDDTHNFLIYIRDLREERALITKLEQSQNMVRIMLDTIPMGCDLRSSDLTLINCNQEVLRLFGLPTMEEYARNYDRLSPLYQPDGTLSNVKSEYYFQLAHEQGTVTFEWMHQTIKEELVPCEITIVSIAWYSKTIFTSYIRDLRELRKALAKLHTLENKVYIDPLTETFNRRYLFEGGEELFQKAVADGTCFAGIILDIDFFKRINDTYGHTAGDVVLKQLTKTISKTLRKDNILARYGGEEFVILLPGADNEIAYRVAERVRNEMMNMTIIYEQNAINITISLGIANIQEDTDNLQQLINCADQALYQAKNIGRNNAQIY